ncbi:MAG: hypothetical protein LBN05_01740 [Oscillospiraceae bacterium]|jgi:hypothetical protein|nr:hypothetical protein [Oscillospiraceae bacterium]
MPYIETVSNQPISRDTTIALKRELGEAITLLGKTESWLQLSFRGDVDMFFKGEPSAQVYARVALLGAAGPSAYEKMTARLCEIYGKHLGTPPDKVYVQYEEAKVWGWNGANF